MRHKILLFGLMIILLSSFVSATTYYNDSFNRGDSSSLGWDSETDSNNFLRISSNTLQMIDTSGDYGQAYESFSDISDDTNLEIQTDIYLSSISSASGGFLDINDDGNILMRFYFDTSGNLLLLSTTSVTIANVPIDTWKTIKFKNIDFTAGNYDFEYDGTTYDNGGLHYNFYQSYIDGLDKVTVTTGGSSRVELKLDDLIFSTGIEPPPSTYLTVNLFSSKDESTHINGTVEIENEGNFTIDEGSVTTTLSLNSTEVNYNITIYDVYENERTYFNVSTVEVGLSNSTPQYNVTVTPYTLITAIDYEDNSSINTFKVDYDGDSYNTTIGNIYLPLQNEVAEVSIYDATKVGKTYSHDSINITANPEGEDYEFTLYPYNSVFIDIYNEETGNLITDNITIVAAGTSEQTTYYTSSGSLDLENMTADSYTFSFSGENYTTRSYEVTVGTGTHQQLNAYLSNASNTVLFYIKDSSTGSSLEGATLSISRMIDDELTTVANQLSDISGNVLFYYEDGIKYYFTASKGNYESKVFSLNPITAESYNILLIPDTSLSSVEALSGVSVTHYINPYYAANGVNMLSDRFYNDQDNNFTFVINDPSGRLVTYGYSLTYPAAETSNSANNAYGGTLENEITITGATILDTVDLHYYYTLSTGVTHNFTESFSIDGDYTNGTIAGLKGNQFGLGVLERVLIVVIVVGIMAGLIGLFTGPVAGGAIAVFMFGFFLNTGFLEIWFIALPVLLILMWIIWRSE